MDDVYEDSGGPKQGDTSRYDEGDGDSSGDDDVPDWTKFASVDANKPVIPKRGEKEFEPGLSGPSALQQFSLDRSRTAMINALRATRSISSSNPSKSVSQAIWFPNLARAHVIQARGIHFSTMGHTARRAEPCRTLLSNEPNEDSRPKKVARLELLPEEALYLLEKGSLQCWKDEGNGNSQTDDPNQLLDGKDIGSTALGTPMSLQQGYAEMIGREDLTLERYQTYAYLKRLGFVITRAEAPLYTPSYPLPLPQIASPSATPPLSHVFKKVISLFSTIFRRITTLNANCWPPLALKGLAWRWSPFDYPLIYKNLRIVPTGHATAIRGPSRPPFDSPYKVFFHVWKPNTPWKKTTLPAPDFELIVIDAQTTEMPSLFELGNVFTSLPVTPLPPPRRRGQPSSSSRSPAPLVLASSPAPPNWIRRLLQQLCLTTASATAATTVPAPNPFAALKAGNKNVIIAVVDNGTNTFIRLGQGRFEEWPMV